MKASTHGAKRAGGFSAAALAIALTGGILTAPSAAASADNSITFTNDALYFVDTCYEWQGPDDIAKENYCHHAKAKGKSWQAYFPSTATGATVKVTFAGYTGGTKTVTIDDANKNHCYKLEGVWPNVADVLRVNC
ncbi:hypothetical protein AB0B07_21905 [Streptomyces sioyaensis]|uniref:hypothetical protein n=1 Tax=Streptomyces sioyaensis TaxID=67364 RepID=UPI0033D8B3AC